MLNVLLIKRLFLPILLTFGSMSAQNALKIQSNIGINDSGHVYFLSKTGKVFASDKKGKYTLSKIEPKLKGTDQGVNLEFSDTAFSGILYYGLIDYKDAKYALPVFFRKKSRINNGKAAIPIKKYLSGKYDIVNWQKNKKGILGYRIQNEYGNILYEGRINFTGNTSFEIANTITEGPFVNLITDRSAVISLKTLFKSTVTISIDGKEYKDNYPTINHEISITGLKPEKEYSYSVLHENFERKFSFKTAPKPGMRHPFVFGYASDSRGGIGGGERDVYGVNYYILKKIMALAAYNNVSFFQFTGDMISGYSCDKDETDLQYANMKRAVEPFAHYFPIYYGIGNHEVSIFNFSSEGKGYGVSIERFPYATESSEIQFASNFVLPENGPQSEDGAIYDPDKNELNFPPYKETVYYYTYDNAAMIVLNSDYWYAPSLASNNRLSGNLHGYVMDKQLDWFSKTLTKLEKDKNIDHVFVTLHTPIFPNGGHLSSCMWYKGDNSKRTVVAGKPVSHGIIERRDQLLDMMINKSNKVVAVLTGDEHNYCRLKIDADIDMYPKNYDKNKITISRTFWQINNGAAGAPYYALQKAPWTDNLKRFSTQNALVLIYVDGKNVSIKVLNPDTLELIDEAVLVKK